MTSDAASSDPTVSPTADQSVDPVVSGVPTTTDRPEAAGSVGPAEPAIGLDDRSETEPALPTIQDLRSLSAELDEVDEVLARLDAEPEAEPGLEPGQPSDLASR